MKIVEVENNRYELIDNYKDGFDRDIHCYYYSNKLFNYGFPNFHTAYEIYPMLSLINLKQSDFCIGETFNIKGLPFYITDDCSAIATKSIGFSTFCLFLETAFSPEVMIPFLSGDTSDV